MARYRDGHWIGDSIALGRTNLTPAERFANVVPSKLLVGHAGVALALDKTARPIVPTDTRATNPTTGEGSGGVPKPVIIGAAALGVLAVGLLVFKVTKK